MMEDLIKELNEIVPYGIEITNSITEVEDIETYIGGINKKSLVWKVRSYINEDFASPSITTYNENLEIALKDNIEECKELFNE
jgi:hypothetical protein